MCGCGESQADATHVFVLSLLWESNARFPARWGLDPPPCEREGAEEGGGEDEVGEHPLGYVPLLQHRVLARRGNGEGCWAGLGMLVGEAAKGRGRGACQWGSAAAREAAGGGRGGGRGRGRHEEGWGPSGDLKAKGWKQARLGASAGERVGRRGRRARHGIREEGRRAGRAGDKGVWVGGERVWCCCGQGRRAATTTSRPPGE